MQHCLAQKKKVYLQGDEVRVHLTFAVTDKQLVTSILQTEPTQAPGPDRLRGRVLKGCSSLLGGVLTRLFQLLLDSGFHTPLYGLCNCSVIRKATVIAGDPSHHRHQSFQTLARKNTRKKIFYSICCNQQS